MGSNSPNQNTTSSEPTRVEKDEDTLAQLNGLLARNSEVTVGDRESRDFDELYVLPDPDPESGIHVVMGLSVEGELSHVATFDTGDCEATAVQTKSVEE